MAVDLVAVDLVAVDLVAELLPAVDLVPGAGVCVCVDLVPGVCDPRAQVHKH